MDEKRHTSRRLSPPLSDLSKLSDTVPAVLYTYEVDGNGRDRFRFVSDRVLDWLGHPPAAIEAEPRLLWDSIHEEDRARVARASADAVRARQRFEAEFRIVHEDGAVRWVRAESRPESVADTGARVYHGVIIDITERRKDRARQEAQRELLEHIARGLPLPHLLDELARFVEAQIDGSQATIQLLDPASKTLRFGAAPTLDRDYLAHVEGTAIGPEVCTCGTALHFGSQVITADIEADPNWGAAVETARAFGLAACWSTPFFGVDGGSAGTLAVYFTAPRSPTREELELLASAADVAGIAFQREESQRNLQETEEQLHHAQKMEAVGQLAGGIAHDFNNILTVILGASGLLIDELGSAPAAEEAQMVQEAASRAAGLTRQLLAFSRKQSWSPTSVDVGAVCRALRPLLERTLGADVAQRYEVTPDLAPAWVDRGQLEQVLLNLVVNAKDAMPDGGALRVSVEPGALPPNQSGLASPRIVVEDTGVGMSAHVVERVFEPFFSTKARDKGTGLGLATAYGIIDRAGGRISVSSEPGQGTRFVIELPASDEADAGSSGPASRAAGSMRARGAERVLLVEDEYAVRRLASRVLRSYGYEVQEAVGGEEALAALRAADGHFALVLTDVVMPGMNGVELAREVRERYAELKILFMSAYTDNLLLVQDPLVQDARLLSKPFDGQRLARTVREVIDGAAAS